MSSAPLLPGRAAIPPATGLGRVCIVGGGVSGIAAARVLLAEGAECTLFEKAPVLGGVWASNYTGYGIQVPAALYEFPDEPLPSGFDFADGPRINRYVGDYAEKHGVLKAARLGCSVERIEPLGASASDSRQWHVEVLNAEGCREAHVFDFVVIASGIYSQVDKLVPRFEGDEAFLGLRVHSVDLTDISVCSGKQVVTVGYGKSAFDIAMSAADVASKSTLLFRQAHWPVPRKILGLIPFEYATFSRLGSALLLPSYPVMGPLERILHSIPLLLKLVWWLVAQIFSFQFGLRKTPGLLPENSFIEDLWCGHGIVPHPSFFRKVHSGEIATKHGEIRRVKQRSVELMTGEELPADILVFGTGFRQNWSFLPEALQAKVEEDGLWLYRQMVHPEFPSLCLLNSNTTSFTNITTAALQARWFHEVMSQGLLPSAAKMDSDIQQQKQWKRAAMPDAGSSRARILQTHQLHYYDQLLKDMGASVRRKRGCLKALKEFADPYRPRDYDTIVSGEFKQNLVEYVQPGSKQYSFCWELGIVVAELVLIAILATFSSQFLIQDGAAM